MRDSEIHVIVEKVFDEHPDFQMLKAEVHKPYDGSEHATIFVDIAPIVVKQCLYIEYKHKKEVDKAHRLIISCDDKIPVILHAIISSWLLTNKITEVPNPEYQAWHDKIADIAREVFAEKPAVQAAKGDSGE